ncbi:hypothetical protein CKO28_01665 [Rhodovibrio sodomensis]|uniref:PilZ domain-containing protein n=1 Tax=Rhodovibrio sodomensis TaxID=1088 RepID=A0ABS1D8L6_9PROT|nr:hypothetical protein [Rhodovibrio sodomensis]MBK1666751.1 hypothetical protein [Rhodovibrio sodomensis]
MSERTRSRLFAVDSLQVSFTPIDGSVRAAVHATGRVSNGGHSDPQLSVHPAEIEDGFLLLELTALDPRPDSLVNAACWTLEASGSFDIHRSDIEGVIVLAAQNSARVTRPKI